MLGSEWLLTQHRSMSWQARAPSFLRLSWPSLSSTMAALQGKPPFSRHFAVTFAVYTGGGGWEVLCTPTHMHITHTYVLYVMAASV